MLDGFYTAASGVLTQSRVFNVLSNNIANQKTPGFQAEQVVSATYDFADTLRIASGRVTRIGSASPVRIVREVPVHYGSGLIEESGRSLDFAISGAGFFNIAVEAAEGGQAEREIYLTRNGSFALDEEGYLVLDGVGRVQGTEGDLRLETSDFIMDGDGTLYDGNGEELGRILLTDPDNGQLLRVRNGLYQAAEPAAVQPVDTSTRLVQGALETSNVDTQRVMTQVMESQRALQACSQILKIIDQVNVKAATQIAKL